MSYQAITDIIVNPTQLQELQLSNTVKDSPIQPSVSFSDYLASFNNAEISKPESNSAQTERPVSEVSDAAKTEKTDVAEKTSENKALDEKEPEKISEKTVEKTDSKEKSDTKVSEKSDSKGKAVKKSDFEVKNSSDEKKTAKAESKEAKDSKNKKLSDKDFSRLDEITKNAHWFIH